MEEVYKMYEGVMSKLANHFFNYVQAELPDAVI